ncbi:hypothetical protein HDU80_000275 [Chytriomyces hyalinus]|nr:hypothetical protein HDU80_000275 [Chytriomyces hyalinus]
MNLRLVHKAFTSTTGFIEYKSKWGAKYHGDTEDGLHALYTRLLDGFDGPEGPIDELSGLPTTLRTFRPITRNCWMWVWQRWDVDKGRDDDEQDGAHFSQPSNRFANDDTREYIEAMLIEIVATSESLIRIPATWNSRLPIPAVPVGFYDFSDEVELDTWLDVHLDKVGAGGRIVHAKWWHNEQAKSNPRPVTISRKQVKDVWRANGGSWCRYFGVKGRWVPGSRYLLSFDKLDVTRGYEVGNLIVCLHRANDARYIYPHVDFLRWRDGVLTLPWRVEE